MQKYVDMWRNAFEETTYSECSANKIKNAWFLSAIPAEKRIALNTLHEVVPTWYSFHSWVDWSNANKVTWRNILMPGFEQLTYVSRNRHSSHMTNVLQQEIWFGVFNECYQERYIAYFPPNKPEPFSAFKKWVLAYYRPTSRGLFYVLLLISSLNGKLIVINSGITFCTAREEKRYSQRHAYIPKCHNRFLV